MVWFVIGTGQNFERVVLELFNNHFKENNIRAIAWRLPQLEYRSQVFDLFIDSLHREFYTALECKNIDVSNKDFYLSTAVKSTDIFEQLRFLKLSGRTGYYVINLRFNRGIYKTYLVPINSMFDLIKNKKFDEKLTLENGGAIISENNGKGRVVNLSYFKEKINGKKAWIKII